MECVSFNNARSSGSTWYVDAQEKVPILGGALRGEPIIEFCSREVALVTPESGELWFVMPAPACLGVRFNRLDLDRLRKGVIRASADLPDRTGRDTEARTAGSCGSDATSRYRFWLLRKAVTTPRSKCSSMASTSEAVLLRLTGVSSMDITAGVDP